MAPSQTAVATVSLRMTFAVRRSSFRPCVAAFANHAMATAQIGEDRFVPLVAEFRDGLRVRLAGDSRRYQSPFGAAITDYFEFSRHGLLAW
jgi:hypothetical protein